MKCRCGEQMDYTGGYRKEVATPNGVDYYFVEVHECKECCNIIENEKFEKTINNEDL